MFERDLVSSVGASKNIQPQIERVLWNAHKFVILSSQRTGSNWVSQRLGMHPEVEINMNYFLPTIPLISTFKHSPDAHPPTRL